MRWRCPDYARLHHAEWEEEHFIFNPASGDTHLLNQLSMEILRLLGDSPRNSSELASLLQHPDSGAEALPPELLEQHLRQLAQMGLIAPVDHEHRPA